MEYNIKQAYLVEPEKVVFALDVGTRNIVGVVCYPEEDNLRILDLETKEHRQRDMIDGQIHHVERVSQTVIQVKNNLEERLGFQLNRVSVAAAGRALKTVKVKSGKEMAPDHRITSEEVSHLELEAAEKAKQELSREEPHFSSGYYCVGYTTVQYFLDEHPISSLISQQGRYIEVEVLATFLPATVVDSLLTVVDKAELTLHSLTLEPIAAAQALIPPEYRHLNLALVDIGAGTSDIAITSQGSIIAYAMVPEAGDEITEKLADYYLLDFQSAEKLKLQLSQGYSTLQVADIIGNTREVSREELLETVQPVIQQLAGNIASAITYFNRSSPRALFCIGGGSQTPLLREKLSEIMEIPLERIAVRDYNSLNRILHEGSELKGPECVTPYGIALSSLKEQFFGFSYVSVNGKVVRLLETEPTTIGKVLLTAGYNPRALIGLRGPSLHINVDGEEKVFPGKPGDNACIWLNGEAATLESVVKPNDEIVIEAAQEGEKPEVTVEDVLDDDRSSGIFLKGARVEIPYTILVNEKPAEPSTRLSDGDRVQTKELGTLHELSQLTEIDFSNKQIRVNGKEADLSYRLQPGDRIDWE